MELPPRHGQGIPWEGPGLVAARDIAKGEMIFKDKPVIKLAINADGKIKDPKFMMTPLKQQIDCMPAEAKAQFHKLSTHHVNICHSLNLSSSDKTVFKKFWCNSKYFSSRYAILHLNLALVNHSCQPNATSRCGLKQMKQEGEEDHSKDLRAIKDIRKGEEITIFYFKDVKEFGSNLRKRKTAIKKAHGFDCKCPVCLGQVPLQEKTFGGSLRRRSRLRPFRETLSPSRVSWRCGPKSLVQPMPPRRERLTASWDQSQAN